MLNGAMGVQGIVVKSPDASWVEIEDFCPCPDWLALGKSVKRSGLIGIFRSSLWRHRPTDNEKNKYMALKCFIILCIR